MSDVIAFLVCFALFVGGLVLLGVADAFPPVQPLVFFAGIVCVALSFGIPVHILGYSEQL